MGCDIHLRLERRLKKEKKIIVSPEEKDENGNVVKKEISYVNNDVTWHSCHNISYNDVWSDRLYGMFALLSNVRNYWDYVPIKDKGFPMNADIVTIKTYMFEIATWLSDDVDDDGLWDRRLVSKNKAIEWLKKRESDSKYHCYKFYEYEETGFDKHSFREIVPDNKWIITQEANKTKLVEDMDYHSPNWCTTSEMEYCINKIFKNEDGEWNGDYIEWLGLLGTMKGYESSGEYEVRAVFWFDN